MNNYTMDPSDLRIEASEGLLQSYEFGSCVAKHYFCTRCGIYTFHQTMRKKGHYRINIGCLDHVDSSKLPYDLFDGASI